MTHILNYIGGEYRNPIGDLWLSNFEPATGQIYSQVASSDRRDVDLAVVSAMNAFPEWSSMVADERSRILLRLADEVEKRIDDFALAETKDQGKPLWLSRNVEIPRAIRNLRFFATEILHSENSAYDTSPTQLNYTLRRPIGVVGCISPWNLPLYLFTWKIAPALSAGNCVVAKPSELTPMTAAMLGEMCSLAGLPAGVLNILQGLGPNVGQAIVEHPEIKAVSFTGGTKTGETLARTAAPMFKKISLELGGKNPTVIFADCDYDKALTETVRSAFQNQGEICLCGSRILVQAELYARFKQDFVEKARALTVGDPLDPSSHQGALVNQAHMEKILSYIDLAKDEGGKILCGGERVTVEGRCKDGWFVAPTVIEGLPQNCRTNQEEIFGPVVTIAPFETATEAIELANATDYGLAANIWTSDLSQAHRVAHDLNFGIVWVNCWLERDLRTPFGGVKSSGVGREGGTEALRFFTEAKNISLQL